MLTIVSRLYSWLTARAAIRIDRIMLELYPEAEDRALAYAGMAAETMEIAATGEGYVIGQMVIEPGEDGYRVGVVSSDEVESDA